MTLNSDDGGQLDQTIRYPHRNGDTIVLGPGVFTDEDHSVINWEGKNYYPEPEEDDDGSGVLVVTNFSASSMMRDAQGREFHVSTSTTIVQVKPDEGGKWTEQEGNELTDILKEIKGG